MKIICIGRNYSEHARELNNEIPAEPVFFLKPDTAPVLPNFPFFYPSFSQNIHYECEIVVKINRLGKNIEERFAHRYYNEIALGIDFTARDLQDECKKKGLPWEKAKAFDGSAVLGKFIPIDQIPDKNQVHFQLLKNGEKVQDGNSSDMIFSIDRIISYLSQYFTFKIGDLIFTGTPAGVGPVKIGDHLEGILEGSPNFSVYVK